MDRIPIISSLAERLAAWKAQIQTHSEGLTELAVGPDSFVNKCAGAVESFAGIAEALPYPEKVLSLCMLGSSTLMVAHDKLSRFFGNTVDGKALAVLEERVRQKMEQNKDTLSESRPHEIIRGLNSISRLLTQAPDDLCWRGALVVLQGAVKGLKGNEDAGLDTFLNAMTFSRKDCDTLRNFFARVRTRRMELQG